MYTYEAKKFALPDLKNISQKQLEIHIGLYQGYVKHVNLLREQIADLSSQDLEKYHFAIESIRRRLGFEFNGMRMHELYFSQWENGPHEPSPDTALSTAIAGKYGSWEAGIDHFKKVGMSRGPGWCTLAWDPKGKTPHIWWTADHEIGMLADVHILLTMDMWEHAYMVDYMPAEKAHHMDAFFQNLNWNVVEQRFAEVQP